MKVSEKDRMDWTLLRALLVASISCDDSPETGAVSDEEKVSVLVAALDRAYEHGRDEAIAAAYRRGLEDAANLVEDGDFLDHELAAAIRKRGEDATNV